MYVKPLFVYLPSLSPLFKICFYVVVHSIVSLFPFGMATHEHSSFSFDFPVKGVKTPVFSCFAKENPLSDTKGVKFWFLRRQFRANFYCSKNRSGRQLLLMSYFQKTPQQKSQAHANSVDSLRKCISKAPRWVKFCKNRRHIQTNLKLPKTVVRPAIAGRCVFGWRHFRRHPYSCNTFVHRSSPLLRSVCIVKTQKMFAS